MARSKADTQLNQFLAVVRRYHDTLRTHSLLCRDVQVPNIVWIRSKFSARITPKWMEGVELFALLAYVDWALWKQEAQRIWPESPCDEWTSQPDHVGIDMMLYQGSPQILENQFNWLATTSQVGSQQKQLQDARVLAHKVLVARGKTIAHVPVRLRGYNFNNLLNRIMELVLGQGRLASFGTGNKTRVEGGGVYDGVRVQYLHIISDFPISTSLLQCLAVVATEGVHISNLQVLERNTVSNLPRASLQWLWQLLAVGHMDDVTRLRGAQHWTVCLAHPSSTYPGLFSAIRASRSLCGFSTDASENGQLSVSDRSRAWSWIAYALISSTPDHLPQLKNVALDVHGLTCEDVGRVKEVLSAPDPLALLLHSSPSLASESISASRFWLVDPMTGNVATKIGGCGPLQIQLIPHLTLTELGARTKDAVVELLRVIGSETLHLTLASRDNMYQDLGMYGSICGACSNLQQLEITRATIESLQFLVDGYASGTCRIAVFKLLVALSDEHHPAAHHLREFVIHPVTADEILKPKIETAMWTMLEQNKRLCVFDLRFGLTTRTGHQERLIKAFDGEQVSMPRASLDIHHRLAFLSTIHPRQQLGSQRQHRERALEKLDANVLALIFSMAAKCVKRRVYVGPEYKEVDENLP